MAQTLVRSNYRSVAKVPMQLFHALINMCAHHTLMLKLSSFQVFDLLAVGYHGYYESIT